MRLIKPSFEIISKVDGEQILKDIEIAARTCYKSEDKIEYVAEIGNGKPMFEDYYAKSARPLIKMLISKGHEAMLEFGGNITVKFICDRGVSHELVRHRLCSFAQESTRYCNYGNDEHITFIIPSWSDLEPKTWDSEQMINGVIDDNPINLWMWVMIEAEASYNRLIEMGWQPQQARSVLPNSLKTEINVSTNIRDWRHIFNLRCAPAAHPQMRELMIPLLAEFKKRIPILFDDINF